MTTVDPGAGAGGAIPNEPMEPIKPQGEVLTPTGKPLTRLKGQQKLTPKEAAEVYQKVLVKQLLMQSLQELRKEQKKQREIERGNI